jgi:uncharacterized protein YggT (Ycf19 family)
MSIRRSTEEVNDGHADHDGLEHDQRRRVTTVEEERVGSRDAELTGEEEVTSSSPGRASVARRLMGTLALFAGIGIAVVETLLGFRLAFLLSEANAANGFVDFIYDVTKPLVEPFQGIIANDTLNNGGLFEPATVIAMVVYLLAAVLVIAVILAAASGMGPDRNTVVTSRSRHRDRAVQQDH